MVTKHHRDPKTREHVSNGSAYKEKEPEKQNGSLSRKVYTIRNSYLTDLMEINHLQSVYNISVAVCLLLFMSSVIFYVLNPADFWRDLAILRWGGSKMIYFIVLWLYFNTFAYLVYEGFKVWVIARNTINSKVADFTFLILYVTSSIFMYLVSPYAIVKYKIPPITTFATLMEMVRIYMKIHSFVVENVPRAKQYKPHKDGNQLSIVCPSKRQLLYFLFAPTLIYRDQYPRTKSIDWSFVRANLFKFYAVLFITYCLFMRFAVDVFKNVGLQPFNRKETALIVAGSIATGSITMFLMFYGLLHCWLNAFAEMLRFGDREFYQDWWNSTSFSQYYRRWNGVVHDWLHAYIYTELQKIGFSRSAAMVIVVFVSAVIHEYILCFTMGYFYPVLLLSYTTIGIFIIFLTKQRTTQFWNTYMWFMLFLGWGVQIGSYSIEWNLRVNCPKQETAADFFIPRTFTTSCQIVDLS